MPKIIDLVRARAAGDESKDGEPKPFIAFEYYPPRTEEGVANLYKRLGRMAKLNPLYVDFTWGAGGTTSDLTLELVVESRKRFGLETNMHITCTNMESEKITKALQGAEEGGITNLLALRGDPPKGEEKWEATEGGFTCALDLVRHIKKTCGDKFGLSVAGYPEGHPNVIKKVEDPGSMTETERGRCVEMEDGVYVCSDADFAAELAYLKQKVDAGAEFIVTQMFFEVSVFTAFVKACREVGINCPIIPGIMLVQNAGGFSRMTAFCKSRVPAELKAQVEAAADAKAVRAVGIAWATAMCKQLVEEARVPGLHFYTLNLEAVLKGVLKNLGLMPEDNSAETEAAPAAAATPAAATAGADDADAETQTAGTILAD